MRESRIGRMIDQIDEKLDKRNSEGAIFHKAIFHVHTPASYDYGLFKKNDLNSIPDEELFGKMQFEGFPLDKKIHSIQGLKEVDKENIYESGREMALYCLMAYKLVKEDIKLALVTDHNTLSGVCKLIQACKINKKYLNCAFPKIMWGVEISCSDKHHVVAILDERRDCNMIKKAESWLEKYIISTDGTYLPSLLVIEEFIKMGAIAYIAHFNTSDIFKEPKFLNGIYKEKLFTVPEMKTIGLSDLSKKEWVQKQINPIYTTRSFNFILDEDSHTLDELGLKPFWLKGQTLNFDTILYAFDDFENSISFSKVSTPNTFIKALYIEGKTFINSGNKEGVVFTFSKRMNCFIGGRGSGKSTVLNTLEFLISQIIENEKIFDSVLPQGDLCVLCEYEGVDYYITSLNANADNNEEFKRNYFLEDSSYMRFDSITDEAKRKEVLGRIQVWTKQGKGYYEITQRKKLLDAMFTRKFSISNLVNSANSNESINSFLHTMIQGDRVLKRKIKINTKNDWKSIGNSINKIQDKLEDQLVKIEPRIKEYNSRNVRRLKMIYHQLPITKFDFRWKDVIHLTKANINDSFYSYDITYGEVASFLIDLSIEMGPFAVINLFITKNYEELEQSISIKEYKMKNSIKVIDSQFKKVEEDTNREDLLCKIQELIRKVPYFIVSELKRYYAEADIWSLEFNIHNRTGNEERNPEYKLIYELSMGQKVVTMLNFILSFSEFIEDYSPLIIDQPEDNLDNQYIYNNLVQIFKNLKNSRQVIVASHNSTIVVNSSSELVYVMDSNAHNGWIERKGFCKEPKILSDIINKLEGGMRAFDKKKWLYQSLTNRY